ncbi:phospholipase D-like domain-containing protein [Marinitoga lauensis]|uniref:phospholipase D-like domain-containing protein n=1 Tax=Marinitoga lauensis TaxID=2201189 RepID=UPI0014044F49|nr:phospholipase D-like domain-containing protein [Marinitoga lauensis]
MKKFLFLLAFLVLIISAFSISEGEWIITKDKLNLPGEYFDGENYFWRADYHLEDLKEATELNLKIHNITDDSTILFFDEGNNEKKNWEYIKKLLDGAKKFVWAAIYDINYYPFIQELKKLKKKGIDVKVVYELNNLNSYINGLDNSGIETKHDKNYKLMHDKFIIIDGYCVLTGSTNFTNNGFKYNSNNSIVIFSNELAQDYMNEFKEMFEGYYGKNSLDNKPYKNVEFDSGLIEPYFTPEDDLTDRIIELINKSEKNIDVMIFTFSKREIADALIKAKNIGINVRVIAEEYQSNYGWAQIEHLKENGVNVILDKNDRTFHHKVMIIDGKITITGSFNFTNSAQYYNDENSLVIHSEYISKGYEKEFNRLWEKYTK